MTTPTNGRQVARRLGGSDLNPGARRSEAGLGRCMHVECMHRYLVPRNCEPENLGLEAHEIRNSNVNFIGCFIVHVVHSCDLMIIIEAYNTLVLLKVDGALILAHFLVMGGEREQTTYLGKKDHMLTGGGRPHTYEGRKEGGTTY